MRFQDPEASVPTTGEFKGDKAWLVRAILEALIKTLEHNFLLGRKFSLDEIVIGYTGRTGLSVRIKYKREGDGILMDAICCPDTGALITFKLRSDDTKQITDPTGGDLSPSHIRCLHLLQRPCVAGKWRVCYADNLFTSVKFCWYAWLFAAVLFTGVIRAGRGFAKEAEQEEMKRKVDIEAAQAENEGAGRMKKRVLSFAVEVGKFGAAVSEAAIAAAAAQHGIATAAVTTTTTIMFAVLCVSIYDAKPFNMMTTAESDVTKDRKQRKVWDPIAGDGGEYVLKPFLRWSIQNLYNLNMDGVDLQDQLRWYYRLDGKKLWRQRRWTWAVYLFVINTRAVNAWLLHKMLVRRAAKKWDDELVKRTQALRVRPQRRGRTPWTQPTLLEATKKARAELSGTRHGWGPRPKEMTHLDFRLGLVRGLLGMPVARFGKRARGRKRKAGSSSSSSSSLPIVLSTPERKKARDEAAKKGYSSTKKGSKISGKHQYPRQRASKAGKGLEKSRLENPELKAHRAF